MGWLGKEEKKLEDYFFFSSNFSPKKKIGFLFSSGALRIEHLYFSNAKMCNSKHIHAEKKLGKGKKNSS